MYVKGVIFGKSCDIIGYIPIRMRINVRSGVTKWACAWNCAILTELRLLTFIAGASNVV